MICFPHFLEQFSILDDQFCISFHLSLKFLLKTGETVLNFHSFPWKTAISSRCLKAPEQLQLIDVWDLRLFDNAVSKIKRINFEFAQKKKIWTFTIQFYDFSLMYDVVFLQVPARRNQRVLMVSRSASPWEPTTCTGGWRGLYRKRSSLWLCVFGSRRAWGPAWGRPFLTQHLDRPMNWCSSSGGTTPWNCWSMTRWEKLRNPAAPITNLMSVSRVLVLIVWLYKRMQW